MKFLLSLVVCMCLCQLINCHAKLFGMHTVQLMDDPHEVEKTRNRITHDLLELDPRMSKLCLSLQDFMALEEQCFKQWVDLDKAKIKFYDKNTDMLDELNKIEDQVNDVSDELDAIEEDAKTKTKDPAYNCTIAKDAQYCQDMLGTIKELSEKANNLCPYIKPPKFDVQVACFNDWIAITQQKKELATAVETNHLAKIRDALNELRKDLLKIEKVGQ